MKQQHSDSYGLEQHYSGDDPLKFFVTMTVGGLSPLIFCLLVPEPWSSAFLPLAVFMLVFAFFFGFVLILYGLSALWKAMRPVRDRPLQCPACRTPEQTYLRFNVVQVAPSIYRIRCAECGERWVERR